MSPKPSYARVGSQLERDLRHAPLRDLTAEQVSEARRRGYISERMAKAELLRRNPSRPSHFPQAGNRSPAGATSEPSRPATSVTHKRGGATTSRGRAA